MSRRLKKVSLGLWAGLAIAVLLDSYVLLVAKTRPHVNGDKLRLDQFLDYAAHDGLEEATVLDQDQYVVGTYRRADGSEAKFNVPIVSGGQAQGRQERVHVDTLSAKLAAKAAGTGIVIADAHAKFVGHGAGSLVSHVFGDTCDDGE